MAYSGWELSESERTRVLAMIAPAYPDVVAHHITEALGKFDELSTPPEVSAVIVGIADDGEGCQALVVEIDGSSKRYKPDTIPGKALEFSSSVTSLGGTYHITWSLDKAAGRKPVDSNGVIAAGWNYLPHEVPIKVTPRVFS
jgi:hypothetical protein